MPNLHDMFQFLMIDKFLRDAQDANDRQVSSPRGSKIPLICKVEPYYSARGPHSAFLAILPTIPLKDGLYACRAYTVLKEPLLFFSPRLYNAWEFKAGNFCELLDSVSIIMELRKLWLFADAIDFDLVSSIEPWMHKERERKFHQIYG